MKGTTEEKESMSVLKPYEMWFEATCESFNLKLLH